MVNEHDNSDANSITESDFQRHLAPAPSSPTFSSISSKLRNSASSTKQQQLPEEDDEEQDNDSNAPELLRPTKSPFVRPLAPKNRIVLSKMKGSSKPSPSRHGKKIIMVGNPTFKVNKFHGDDEKSNSEYSGSEEDESESGGDEYENESVHSSASKKMAPPPPPLPKFKPKFVPKMMQKPLASKQQHQDKKRKETMSSSASRSQKHRKSPSTSSSRSSHSSRMSDEEDEFDDYEDDDNESAHNDDWIRPAEAQARKKTKLLERERERAFENQRKRSHLATKSAQLSPLDDPRDVSTDGAPGDGDFSVSDEAKRALQQKLIDEIELIKRGPYGSQIPISIGTIGPNTNYAHLISEYHRVKHLSESLRYAHFMTNMLMNVTKMAPEAGVLAKKYVHMSLGLEHLQGWDHQMRPNQPAIESAFQSMYEEDGPMFKISGKLNLFLIVATSAIATIRLNKQSNKQKLSAQQKAAAAAAARKSKKGNHYGRTTGLMTNGDDSDEDDDDNDDDEEESPKKKQKKQSSNENPSPPPLSFPSANSMNDQSSRFQFPEMPPPPFMSPPPMNSINIPLPQPPNFGAMDNRLPVSLTPSFFPVPETPRRSDAIEARPIGPPANNHNNHDVSADDSISVVISQNQQRNFGRDAQSVANSEMFEVTPDLITME